MKNDFKKGFLTGAGGLLGVLSVLAIPVGIYLIYSLIKSFYVPTTNLLSKTTDLLLRKGEYLDYKDCLVEYNNSNDLFFIGKNFELKVEEVTASDIYQHIIDHDRKHRDLKVKKYLQAVMARDPDRVGEGLRLANELGLPQYLDLDSDQAIELMIKHIQLNKWKYSSVFCGEEPKEWKWQ